MAVDVDSFREALGRWASGVCIVAARSNGRVTGTTVSAFTSLSLDPPLVLVALGPNATVRPFLQPGAAFGISVLTAAQRRLASSYADSFPVGPDPFPPSGVPLIPDALLGLTCTVTEVRDGAGHAIVIAAVSDVVIAGSSPLIRYMRKYHSLPV